MAVYASAANQSSIDMKSNFNLPLVKKPALQPARHRSRRLLVLSGLLLLVVWLPACRRAPAATPATGTPQAAASSPTLPPYPPLATPEPGTGGLESTAMPAYPEPPTQAPPALQPSPIGYPEPSAEAPTALPEPTEIQPAASTPNLAAPTATAAYPLPETPTPIVATAAAYPLPQQTAPPTTTPVTYPGPQVTATNQAAAGQSTPSPYPGPATQASGATPTPFSFVTPTPSGGTPALEQASTTASPTATIFATPTLVRTVLKASDPASFQIVAGKPQLVALFADWSPASRSIAPVLISLEDRFGEGVNFVYLDIDAPANGMLKALLDSKLPPVIYLLDSQGSVLNKWSGFVPFDELEAALGTVAP